MAHQWNVRFTLHISSHQVVTVKWRGSKHNVKSATANSASWDCEKHRADLSSVFSQCICEHRVLTIGWWWRIVKSGYVAALCRLCKPSGKDQQRVGEVKPFEEEDEETKKQHQHHIGNIPWLPWWTAQKALHTKNIWKRGNIEQQHEIIWNHNKQHWHMFNILTYDNKNI